MTGIYFVSYTGQIQAKYKVKYRSNTGQIHIAKSDF